MKKRLFVALLVMALAVGMFCFAPTAQAAATGQDIVNYAKQWIGTPYVWGGTSLSNGIDCSGFVCRVYEHFNINLWGRRSGLRRLVDDGIAIELGTDLSLAQPGDIVTCNDGKHVVIYAGNGRVVQASSNHGVCESPATQAWLGNVISIIRILAVSDGSAAAAATIQPGLYSLAPMCATGKRLDVQDGSTLSGTNVQIWRSNDTAAQQWNIALVGNGYYTLISQESGKALDVGNAKTAQGTNVQQCNLNGNYAQHWRFTDAGDGYYYITTRLDDNMRLDVNEKEDVNGANVQIWSANNSTAQKWKLISVSPGKLTHTHQKGTFQFNEAKHPHYGYYSCSLCGANFTDGSTTTMNKCVQCGTNWAGVSSEGSVSSSATAQQGPQVIEYFDCNVRIYTTEGQAVNAYANILDATRKNWFDRGQTLPSKKGAKVSDGSTWYQVQAVNAKQETVTLWVNVNVPGVTVEDLETKNCDNGHSWTEWEHTKAATCETEGQDMRVCTVCGKSESKTLSALGHIWGEWKTIQEAACGKTGQRQRICTVCGKESTQRLTALSHQYKAVEDNSAYVRYRCVNCGDSYREEKEQGQNNRPDAGMSNFVITRQYSDSLFWDVSGSDWFCDNVAAVYGMGLMKGTGSGTFSPGNNVTLAEAVTLAARLHSIYYTGAEEFPVYDGGNWYDPYVDYARENDIINTYYDYARPATREEFVHILAQALPKSALDHVAGPITFADDGDIIYMSDVELLSGAGVINGIRENGKTYFKPTATITRAEVAAIVGRMAQPDSRLVR